MTAWFFFSALQGRRTIWLEVRKTSGWCCSTKTIGVVCYHKIGQSMQHEGKKRLRELLRGWEGKDPEEERLLKQTEL